MGWGRADVSHAGCVGGVSLPSLPASPAEKFLVEKLCRRASLSRAHVGRRTASTTRATRTVCRALTPSRIQ